MPTYVYECSKCLKSFEVEQRMSDAPLTQCRCGSIRTVERVIQPVGVAFRGTGFHINDYSDTPPNDACSGEPGSCSACKAEAE